MKKILVLGVGAQGSTVARRMDEEPDVAEIICADYDQRAVNELVGRAAEGKRCSGRRLEQRQYCLLLQRC